MTNDNTTSAWDAVGGIIILWCIAWGIFGVFQSAYWVSDHVNIQWESKK